MFAETPEPQTTLRKPCGCREPVQGLDQPAEQGPGRSQVLLPHFWALRRDFLTETIGPSRQTLLQIMGAGRTSEVFEAETPAGASLPGWLGISEDEPMGGGGRTGWGLGVHCPPGGGPLK